MKILVLVNAAVHWRPLFSAVGRTLAARGHEVHYAVDSHYTDVLHPEAPLDGNVHYFSDYWRANFARNTPPAELASANLNLMMFPDVERFVVTNGHPARSPEWFSSLSANLAHFFVDLFDRYKFDSVVYENVSNALSYLACEVAQRRGGRYIGFSPSRMPGRTDIIDSKWSRNTHLESTFNEIRSGALVPSPEVRAHVQDYLANFDDKEPDYMKKNPFFLGVFERYMSSLKPAVRMMRSLRYRVEHAEDARYAFQQPNPFVSFPEQVVRETARQARVALLDSRYYETEIDLSVPYFAYPLQFHPESSTSVDGPAFSDEWSNIVGISQNLPFGYTLYVKDHRYAAGRQSLDFYRRVLRLPNVRLVSPNYHPKKLIRNAKAIVCITSTLGFEAVLLGRPVFVLGHPFYEFFPSVRPIRGFDGAHAAFAKHDEMRASQDEIVAMLSAYYLTSEEGSFDILNEYDDAKLVDRLARVIERKTSEHGARRAQHVEAQLA